MTCRFVVSLLLGCVALGFSAGMPQGLSAGEALRPNIIFILADDLAMGDLGCYGQKLIQTPNMDRMAAEGMRFTQAYAGTSVCAPSRASLMTGLHCGHCPIRANREIRPEGQMPLPPGTVTVAQLLHEAGYATACMGKWGMGMFHTSGSPLKVGFDHFFGYNCQRHAHSYFPGYLYRDDRRFELAPRTYAQELIQQDVERWVRSVKDQPFFLFYAVTLPHGRYEIDDLGIYADRQRWTELQKTYAAMVTRLDSDVGRLLRLLEELDLEENTLVMLAGDNGSSFSPNSQIGRFFNQSLNGRLRGFKRSMYEGGLRQAALAWWPGHVPAGRVCHEPWAFWDFLPTAVELAGARLPGCLAGFHAHRRASARARVLLLGTARGPLHPGRALRPVESGAQRTFRTGGALRSEGRSWRNHGPGRATPGAGRACRGPDEGGAHGRPPLAPAGPSPAEKQNKGQVACLCIALGCPGQHHGACVDT